MAPVGRVIFHHEGAGAPTDNTARPLHERYSIAIGISVYQMANTPARSFRTNGTTGPSLQVVFTGNREVFAVTDADIRLVERAVGDAKQQGWVTDRPTVQFHGDTDPGTACPGRNVKARRADLERACGLLAVTTPPATKGAKPVVIFSHPTIPEAYYVVKDAGTVHPYNAPFHGDLNGIQLAAPIISGCCTPSGNGYLLLGADGGVFAFGDAKSYGKV